ncbi:MAG: dynamin family protein [Bacteroidota bacterium]|nr:dynamin family protein [Bacteroidota bacterium]
MTVIDQQIQEQKNELKHVLLRLQQFTHRISHAESGRILADLRDRIEEPFMFVIVGEVKAGKSSFINALLGDPNLCAVAPSPMTDTIQQIMYGEIARTEEVSPYLKRVFQPNEILKDIAIVDTPGTNTIIQHHQEITERFIPGADLIIFVFEAKNPYRQSAWDFFDFMHEEWHKKIVFVLQQKDLMDVPDLEINLKGLTEYAEKKGVKNPIIFAVSAKDELQGLTEQSGFNQLKKFILDQVTGGRAQKQKLISLSDTTLQIIGKIQSGLDLRKQQLELDLKFREDIKWTLTDHGQRAKHQSDILVENLMSAYDRVSDKYEKELSDSISFLPVLRRSIGSIFSKSQSLKSWLEDFKVRLQTDFGTGMQDKINDRVLDLAESIQQMAHTIDLQLRNSSTILSYDHEIFSEIALRRQNVLRELRDAFDQFINKTENFTTRRLVDTDTKIGTNVAAGSGIAVVGIILAAVTQGMVFDITGGVLTALGFLVAGITLGLQRGKVLKQYRTEMDKGRDRLEQELKLELYSYVESIKTRMNEQFARFDAHLQQESTDLTSLVSDLDKIRIDLGNIKKVIS